MYSLASHMADDGASVMRYRMSTAPAVIAAAPYDGLWSSSRFETVIYEVPVAAGDAPAVGIDSVTWSTASGLEATCQPPCVRKVANSQPGLNGETVSAP